MNHYSTIWRFILMLLGFSMKRCPLLPVNCQSFIELGSLTVKPAKLFLLGSNLTFYCSVPDPVNCKGSYMLSLEVNGVTVDRSNKVNCNTTSFSVFNVRKPELSVLCSWTNGQRIVNGMDLHGGLPPDKPANIKCETSRSSDVIGCSWERGRETYLPEVYNVSVSSENGTQVQFYHVQRAQRITIPQTMIDENTKYQLSVTAYNDFGAAKSDPFSLSIKDIEIPKTPQITEIKFGSLSNAAILHWHTSDSSEHLRSDVRLRTDNAPWELGEVTDPHEDPIQVVGLKPLTDYEFQMRTCQSASDLMHTDTPSFTNNTAYRKRSFCSKWSPSVRAKTPGKGPSEQLHVWRVISSHGINVPRNVTVLWKPPPPEDHSGEVQQYKIFVGNDRKHEETCHAALSRCSVQVPAEVQEISVSAVTLYGTSPPADVPLRHSGDLGPVLRETVPAASGDALFASWRWPENKHQSAPGAELLHYVLEWTAVPKAELQWKKVAGSQNSTSVTGLTAGVRYNISLFAVTTRGVSAPSSAVMYSKEQKPVSGPSMSVLVHEARKIQVQWDELPVEQQRGFITTYTVYLQMLDSSNNTELRVTVRGSESRQKWLECPEGPLALQLTASTSAGEGPRGNRITSEPAAPAVDLVVVIVFITTFFIVVIANLMCWRCVRKRIKQTCISWGPAWLDENLPKPENSFAIRLLEVIKQDESEPMFSSTYSDPPLSPILVVSQDEREDVYPTVHVGVSHAGLGQSTAETRLLLTDSQVEHSSYKPQTALLASQEEEGTETEDEVDIATMEEEDRHSSVFQGLLGGFLSSVEVDFSDSPPRLTLSSVSGLFWPKTAEITRMDEVEEESDSLDLQQEEITSPYTANTCFSQYTAEILTGGYFPQRAAVSGTTPADTQR